MITLASSISTSSGESRAGRAIRLQTTLVYFSRFGPRLQHYPTLGHFTLVLYVLVTQIQVQVKQITTNGVAAVSSVNTGHKLH